jgi:hypothetical protein
MGSNGYEVPTRYVLELSYSGEGVSGWLERNGGRPSVFSSWLELLCLLEAPAPPAAPPAENPGSGI